MQQEDAVKILLTLCEYFFQLKFFPQKARRRRNAEAALKRINYYAAKLINRHIFRLNAGFLL